jgi:precorrin-3B C17-methyltransferase
VDTVIGYQTYTDLIRPLVSKEKIISSPMKKELNRVQTAINNVRTGQDCALICSGDPGIYALAGLVFDVCSSNGLSVYPGHRQHTAAVAHSGLCIEIIPGIPALCAGSALLGAPLTHDFAVISLSDLLTPWETIRKRLEAAAAADFVIVLYNPKSRKRDWQLEQAQKIILKHRAPRTPVGIVISAMRAAERISVVTLDQITTAEVNMQTTIFVGNSSTSRYLDFLFTPRGYAEKYDLTLPSQSGDQSPVSPRNDHGK